MTFDEKMISRPERPATYLSDDFFSRNIPEADPLIINDDFMFPLYEPQSDAAPISSQVPNHLYSPAPAFSHIDWNYDAAMTFSTQVPMSPAAALASPYGSSISEPPPYVQESLPPWGCEAMSPATKNPGDLPYTEHTDTCSQLEQAQALQLYTMGLNDFGFEPKTPVFGDANALTFDLDQLFADF